MSKLFIRIYMLGLLIGALAAGLGILGCDYICLKDTPFLCNLFAIVGTPTTLLFFIIAIPIAYLGENLGMILLAIVPTLFEAIFCYLMLKKYKTVESIAENQDLRRSLILRYLIIFIIAFCTVIAVVEIGSAA